MADILSQEEIEALLSVCDTPEEIHQDLHECIELLQCSPVSGTLNNQSVCVGSKDAKFIIDTIQRIVSNEHS